MVLNNACNKWQKNYFEVLILIFYHVSNRVVQYRNLVWIIKDILHNMQSSLHLWKVLYISNIDILQTSQIIVELLITLGHKQNTIILTPVYQIIGIRNRL